MTIRDYLRRRFVVACVAVVVITVSARLMSGQANISVVFVLFGGLLTACGLLRRTPCPTCMTPLGFAALADFTDSSNATDCPNCGASFDEQMPEALR